MAENKEFFDMLKRMIRAGGKRAGQADEHDLAYFAAIGSVFKLHLKEAVHAQRANGKSWSDIGDALGMTRQAAHKRFS